MTLLIEDDPMPELQTPSVNELMELMDEIKDLSNKGSLIFSVPTKEKYPGFYFTYSGYGWTSGYGRIPGSSPIVKRRDYIQLLKYRGKDVGKRHMAFCEPVDAPEELYGRDALVEVKKIGIVDGRIRLVVNGVEGRGWQWVNCPYKKVRDVELTVVNEPYEK